MRLRVYTDGGCSGNPGPGGWAYVIAGDGAKPVIAEDLLAAMEPIGTAN